MNILVLNSGSSSLKYQLIDTAAKTVVIKGNVERIGEDGPPNHRAAVKKIFDALKSPIDSMDKDGALIKRKMTIDAVGHRVVHGGPNFSEATLVTDETLKEVERIAHLAPLHNPAALLGIKACRDEMPDIPNVMVFDTAFHTTMPASAYLYGISPEDCNKHGIRRYGFHGTSHDYVSKICAEMYGKPREQLKIISCHLGNGCSVAAIDRGKSIETSMGLTPLEGLVMGTRSGDIDPAAIEYLSKAHDFTIAETVKYLNKQSGLLALADAGTSDFRDLYAMYKDGNQTVATAFDVFNHRLVKYIGSYIAVMNGVDAIVFTGGIGNNMPIVREKVMEHFAYLGAAIDLEKDAPNFCNFKTMEITAKKSAIRTFIIKTDEELSIAGQTADILSKA